MNTRHIFAIGFVSALIGCGGGGSDGGNPPPPPPPPPPPVTVDFALADFTGVTMDASFDYSIQQGNAFAVEVTIDSTYVDDLDVVVDGDMLHVGFKPDRDIRATTLEAVIVLPEIDLIELTGSVHGTVAGFTGNTLDVTVSGSAALEGINLNYSYLTIDGNGSASVDISDVAPLPAADIQLNGSGSATLNLMDFATVTGSLNGTTSLSYYGSNVNLQISTSNGASITRLGGTL